MENKVEKNKQLKNRKGLKNVKPNYYFHADEDFRVDWDWGKPKATTTALTKIR